MLYCYGYVNEEKFNKWREQNFNLIQKMKDEIEKDDKKYNPEICLLIMHAVSLYESEHNGEGCPEDEIRQYMAKVINNIG